jgi:chromosome segregation ATPase
MPTPPNERQALEQELAELPSQIAVYLRELTETPEGIEHRVRRQRLAWQIMNLENRLAEVRARLAGIRAERG